MATLVNGAVADDAATSTPTPRSHPLIALDVLRALAALMVVIVHARSAAFPAYASLPEAQQSALTAIFYGLTRAGKEAVLVFFVLSGYLVGGQVITRLRQQRFRVTDYAIDRAARILPPLIPACLLAGAVGFAVSGVNPDWVQILGNMTGLNGVVVETLEWNGPLWTISFEIWFYIFGGALAAILVLPGRLAPFCLLAAAIAIYCVLDARYLLFWLLGAVMILFRGHERGKLLAMIGLVAFVAGYGLHQLEKESVSIERLLLAPPGFSEYLLCLGIALALPFLTSAKVNQVLKPLQRPFLFLSAMSYSLYLFHYPSLVVLRHFRPAPTAIDATTILTFIGYILVSATFSYLAYCLVERHTDAIRRFAKARLGGAQIKG